MKPVATQTDKPPDNQIPSFYFSPKVRRRLTQIRLHVDLAGVTLVRLFHSVVQNSIAHMLLSIYSIVAWIIILFLDSTRIPESATTRLEQRKSWRFALPLTLVPLIMFIVLTTGFHKRIEPVSFSTGDIVFITIRSYMDEMLFRNTLQPKFRQLGLSRWAAIGMQSGLYGFAIWLQHVSIPIALSFCVLGVANGWMVYRFRSLWSAFAFGLMWNLLWFG